MFFLSETRITVTHLCKELNKKGVFLKPLPPTLSWVLGRHLDWSCICPSSKLYLWCCPIALLQPLSLPVPTCHPTGLRQSAAGFEFLTLISAKLTLNTELTLNIFSFVEFSCELTKAHDTMTLTLTIKNRAGSVMLWLKFQGKIQALLKTMNCHTILSANQPDKLFSWLPIKLQGLEYSKYEKNNDKVGYISVWPWKSAVTAAVGALR